MSIGALIAIVVLVICVVALVFAPGSPSWLPFALIGSLAVAVLLSPFPVKWPGQA